MEYIKKHPYNDTRVGYGMTVLNKEGSLDTLQDTMETDPNWVEVVVPEPTEVVVAEEVVDEVEKAQPEVTEQPDVTAFPTETVTLDGAAS